jgi:hypothetical protein
MATSRLGLTTSEQFQIEEFESIAAVFVRNILGLSPEDCFLSDESDLDDFCVIGSSLETGERSWDEHVIQRIHDEYGVELSTTRMNLVTLFAMIQQAQRKALH